MLEYPRWLHGAVLGQQGEEAGPRPEPQYLLEDSLLGDLRDFIQKSFGLDAYYAGLIGRLVIIAGVLVISVGVFIIAKRILLRGLRALASRTRTQWDDIILQAKVFDRLAYLAPGLIVYVGASYMFPDQISLERFTQRVALAFMILIGSVVADALVDGFVKIYRIFDSARQRPIRSFGQLLKIVIYLVSAILILAVLLDRDPWNFIASLGFMTGLVMLVFKDAILGFVGSIQLTANKMVRVGDWIEMPAYGADGDVIEISLSTVKVQNWDKTVSTIPTYALVTNSFKNWRGMSESGGRRIKRSVHIDMNSVRFCDDEMIERFGEFELVRDYVEERRKEVEEFNREKSVDTSVMVNGRRLTNLGTFRRYVLAYLKNHDKIHAKMTLLVRQLQPTQHGIPIEIYCFSNDQAWANYESIQADIFDHILAVIPEFGLRVFQSPSGGDVQSVVGEIREIRGEGDRS